MSYMVGSWQKQVARRFIPSLTHLTHLEVAYGKGCYLFDRAGKRYLDFCCGIGVTNLGHCPPAVVRAIQKQAEKLLHICFGVAYFESQIQYGEALAKALPRGLDRFFFCQSGAEAVEGALKLARYVTKKKGFVAFQGGFHGRTLGAISITSSKPHKYRDPYVPLIPHVQFAPYPYCVGCVDGNDSDPACQQFSAELLAQVEGLMGQVGRTEEGLAAVIFEPVLGEGGYMPAARSFVKGLRALCDSHGVLLIFDEVQSGFGRTGKFMALEHYGVVPDVLVLAKAIASGMPLGAIVTHSKWADQWPPGTHGSTFSGNPLSCAAALATLQEIKKRKLVVHAAKMGKMLMTRLRSLQKQYPQVIREVRGLGLMIGVEFVQPNGEPNPQLVQRLRDLCLADGLLLLPCGSHDQVVRFVPPLIVQSKQIDEALSIFQKALSTALTTVSPAPPRTAVTH